MEETQNGNPRPSRIERITARWQCTKKQWATIGGVVLTIGALVVTGLRTGVPWHMAPKK
jgi:hypothetical protein